MRKTFALWSILALCLLLTAVAQPSLGATKDTPLEYGKEYTVSNGATQKWYISVNLGDTITVNVSKVVSYYAFVNIDPNLRYSSSSDDSLLDASGTTGTGMLSPFTFWFVCAHTQLIWLEFKTQVISSSPSMTYNITRVNGTISQMPADIAKLKQDVSALNASLSTLNTTVANLTAAFLANLTIVNDTLTGLLNYTNYLNESIWNIWDFLLPLMSDAYMELSWQSDNITWLWENITRLGGNLSDLGALEMTDYNNLNAQLAALNASLAEADASLWALVQMNDTTLKSLLEANNGSLNDSILGLSERLVALRGEVQNISFPTPEQYNDTLLWKEIGRLNATPPVTIVQANNTTVNPVTLTNTTSYVNRTYETAPNDVTGVVAASIFGGGIAGMTMGYFSGRRRKDGELTPVPPAEPATEAVPYKMRGEAAEGEIDEEI